MGAFALKKKKDKKPLKSLLRLLKVVILAGVLLAKLNLLLRAIETAIKFKFLLVAVGGLLIHGVKLWMDLKANKKHDHDEGGVVYRNPYEHGGDWNSGGPEYHSRSYHRTEGAQNLAYSQSKPQ
ncbi:hypothetical protein NQ318_005379 [Aromia moschata]|uniref:Uncharacterized protein n=1 Tax=Aromia moschata TaxID=1265417 RepID=A0AAV8YXV1_9CUCU|nr:hypothetical protein NQ318_005379 [Aromia moschata]